MKNGPLFGSGFNSVRRPAGLFIPVAELARVQTRSLATSATGQILPAAGLNGREAQVRTQNTQTPMSSEGDQSVLRRVTKREKPGKHWACRVSGGTFSQLRANCPKRFLWGTRQQSQWQAGQMSPSCDDLIEHVSQRRKTEATE